MLQHILFFFLLGLLLFVVAYSILPQLKKNYRNVSKKDFSSIAIISCLWISLTGPP